jgi:hypothetical protein
MPAPRACSWNEPERFSEDGPVLRAHQADDRVAADAGVVDEDLDAGWSALRSPQNARPHRIRDVELADREPRPEGGVGAARGMLSWR